MGKIRVVGHTGDVYDNTYLVEELPNESLITNAIRDANSNLAAINLALSTYDAELATAESECRSAVADAVNSSSPADIPESVESCYRVGAINQLKALLHKQKADIESELANLKKLYDNGGRRYPAVYGSGRSVVYLPAGYVSASAEIAGDPKKGVFIIDEAWSNEKHGYMLNTAAVHGMSWFYNTAIYPIHEKLRPSFRKAFIIAIGENVATVRYVPEEATLYNNSTVTLDDESYETTVTFSTNLLQKCAVVGDEVVVRFKGTSLPAIVSFVSSEKACGRTNLLFYDTSTGGIFRKWVETSSVGTSVSGYWDSASDVVSYENMPGLPNGATSYYCRSIKDQSLVMLSPYAGYVTMDGGSNWQEIGGFTLDPNNNMPVATDDKIILHAYDEGNIRSPEPVCTWNGGFVEQFDEVLMGHSSTLQSYYPTEFDPGIVFVIQADPENQVTYYDRDCSQTFKLVAQPDYVPSGDYSSISRFICGELINEPNKEIVQMWIESVQEQISDRTFKVTPIKIWSTLRIYSCTYPIISRWSKVEERVIDADGAHPLTTKTFSFSKDDRPNYGDTIGDGYHLIGFDFDDDRGDTSMIFRNGSLVDTLTESYSYDPEWVATATRADGVVLMLMGVSYYPEPSFEATVSTRLYTISGSEVTLVDTVETVEVGTSGGTYYSGTGDQYMSDVIDEYCFFYLIRRDWDTRDETAAMIRVDPDFTVVEIELPFSMAGPNYQLNSGGSELYDLNYRTGDSAGLYWQMGSIKRYNAELICTLGYNESGTILYVSDDYGITWHDVPSSQLFSTTTSNLFTLY